MLALLAAVTLSLHLERVQESLTGTHYTYRQYANGVPLLGPGVRAAKVALYAGPAGLEFSHTLRLAPKRLTAIASLPLVPAA